MELIFNIWFIVDIGTDLSKYAMMRPYCFDGDENEKENLLKNLAETDFVTVHRYNFAAGCQVKFANLTADGYIHKNQINNFFDLNFDMFLLEMEKHLPYIPKFKGRYLGEDEVVVQKFPAAPKFCLTFLMENEYGDMKPYTKLENIRWIEQEKIRIDYKSKGMQN